jgi:hypothetical protein
MYRTLRTIHLLCGAFALPALLMYGASAVQMAHHRWFTMKPHVSDSDVVLRAGYDDGRAVAREVMASRDLRGDINLVKPTPTGFDIRLVVPGTVHEIRYDRASGVTRVRTSAAGFMGMLNRLHHAAGLWHEYAPLNVWGVLMGVVSVATLGLGVTGIWMWWLRRQERTLGIVLLAANLAFAVTVLTLIRRVGP